MKISRSVCALSLTPLLRVILPAMLLSQMALAQDQENVMFGTWALDVKSSTYHKQQAPENQTRIYEAHANGVQATIIALDAAGEETTVSYTAGFDGMPQPLEGSKDADSVTLTQINPSTTQISLLKDGKATETEDQVIADTGIKMTVTSKVGGEVTSEEVFDKVVE
jgi:hypothetical protein